MGKQQAALAVAGDYAKGLGLMADGKDDEALALMRQIAARTPQFSGPLVNQAVIGFHIWTGKDADPNVMREALEEFLGF